MAIAWTSANSSTNSLTQKIRDLGRHKSKSEEKLEKDFEIVHTPDRPARLISPVEAPTEEECGDEIARWQRFSLRGHDKMFTRHRYENENSDASAIVVESDNDVEEHAQRQHATQVAYVKPVGRRGLDQQTTLKHNQVVNSSIQRQVGPPQTEARRQLQQHQAATATRFQHGNTKTNHAAGKSSPTPAPLFAGSANPPAPRSYPRSVSPALATVAGDNSLMTPRYTRGKGRQTHTNEEDEEYPVDMEQLVRMEIYRRGFCPFCRKFFGHDPLPLECPYLDCERDLRICLEYPNRTELEKAPPRLAQRALLDVRRMEPKGGIRGIRRRLAQRRAVPSLTVEAPTPIDEPRPDRHHTPPSPPPRARQQRPKSPSPSSTIRTIWPSPLGIYNPTQQVDQPPTPERQRYMDKPLPAPPTPPSRSDRRPPPPSPSPPSPPPSTLSDSISDRHQQLYKPQQPQHIASQLLKTPPPSLSSTPAASPPSPLSRRSTTASRRTKSPSPSGSPSPSPRLLLPTSRYRRDAPQVATATATGTEQQESRRGAVVAARPSSSSLRRVDDSAFLAWKRPEEREKFEREVREKGESADLFMDIIGQYGEEEEEEDDGQRKAVGRRGFF